MQSKNIIKEDFLEELSDLELNLDKIRAYNNIIKDALETQEEDAKKRDAIDIVYTIKARNKDYIRLSSFLAEQTEEISKKIKLITKRTTSN
jgi:hypothetical protein